MTEDHDMRPRRMNFNEGNNNRRRERTSGSRRRRHHHEDENSPRTRQHLNDGSGLESSFEVNRSFEEDDLGPDTVVSDNEEDLGSRDRGAGFFSRFGNR